VLQQKYISVNKGFVRLLVKHNLEITVYLSSESQERAACREDNLGHKIKKKSHILTF
jgi:hypothetical protein